MKSQTKYWTLLFAITAPAALHAGDIFGHTGLSGGSRWDAAPRTISGNERSLSGGLRFSLEGGSYTAFRDMFSWSSVPAVASFQLAVEQAFGAWKSVDPASGLGTNLNFTADLGTAVVGTGTFGGVNINGAEIDVFGTDAGDAGRDRLQRDRKHRATHFRHAQLSGFIRDFRRGHLPQQ